jgi:hypothetical protein
MSSINNQNNLCGGGLIVNRLSIRSSQIGCGESRSHAFHFSTTGFDTPHFNPNDFSGSNAAGPGARGGFEAADA